MQSPTKTLLLALLALVASVAARPGGAPACAINEQRITAGMGEPQGDRSFRLEASATEYTPGQPLTMKVTSTNAATRTYKGILLYVQPAAAANQRVGKFTIPQGHRDNTGPCAGANIQAEPESVLTQSSSDDKPLGADIVWTPPANADGDMVVRAVIVGAGPRNWQVLENVTLKKRGGEQPAQGGNNNGNMRRVCKKWRKVQPGAGGNAGGGYGGGPSPTQPAGQQPTQTTGQGATGSETPAPAPPADGQAPPAPPAEGQAPPADGQAPPAPPADGQAPPAPPADGQAPPAPPADGQAPPAPADGQAPPPGPDGQAAAGQVQENNTASNSASGMHKNVATGMAAAVVAVVALAF